MVLKRAERLMGAAEIVIREVKAESGDHVQRTNFDNGQQPDDKCSSGKAGHQRRCDKNALHAVLPLDWPTSIPRDQPTYGGYDCNPSDKSPMK
jgi:hypothetical protein